MHSEKKIILKSERKEWKRKGSPKLNFNHISKKKRYRRSTRKGARVPDAKVDHRASRGGGGKDQRVRAAEGGARMGRANVLKT